MWRTRLILCIVSLASISVWLGFQLTLRIDKNLVVAPEAVAKQCAEGYPQRPQPSGGRRTSFEAGPGCYGIAQQVAAQVTARAHLRSLDSGPTLRVLFVMSRKLYEGMMDSYYTEQMEACDRHPSMDCGVWGPGFDGYRENSSLEENIRIQHGDVTFYDIHVFQPGEPPVTFDSDVPPPGVVRAQRFNEDWNSYNAHLWRRLHVRLVMFSFAQDMFESAAQFRHENFDKVFFHVPMSADPLLYDSSSYVPQQKNVSSLLVGAKDAYCYPMRTRLAVMIEAGLLPGIVRDHPGYISPTFLRRQTQRADYASALRSANAVFVTPSFYHYRLQKFSEVALSGTLMIGPIPQEREELFKDIMVELREDDSDDYISTITKWWLDHHSERGAVSRLAQQVAQVLFTWDVTFADRLYKAYFRLQRGETGWWFTEPFTVRTPRRNVCDCNLRSSEADYVLGPRCPHVPQPQ